jgi:hypothetical protein
VSSVNVLVVFYSRYGRTERLALAAGLGAIEAEGSIRLRRLPDEASPDAIDADAAWRTACDRMSRDYVAPRPADPVWADVIVLATPPESCREVEAYVSTLPSLGPMQDKLAAPLTQGDDLAVLGPVFMAAGRCGLVAVPLAPGTDDAVTSARLHGQRLVRMARALKSAQPDAL